MVGPWGLEPQTSTVSTWNGSSYLFPRACNPLDLLWLSSWDRHPSKQKVKGTRYIFRYMSIQLGTYCISYYIQGSGNGVSTKRPILKGPKSSRHWKMPFPAPQRAFPERPFHETL